jgi:hypothetical protein
VILFAALLALSVTGFSRGVSAQVVGPAKSTVTGSVLNSDGTPAVAVGVRVLSSENPECECVLFVLLPGREQAYPDIPSAPVFSAIRLLLSS